MEPVLKATSEQVDKKSNEVQKYVSVFENN